MQKYLSSTARGREGGGGVQNSNANGPLERTITFWKMRNLFDQNGRNI